MNLPNPPMAESAGLREIKSYLSVLSAELRRILLNLDESNLSAEALSRLKASFSKADAASKLLNRFTVRGDFTGKASGITGILPLENGGTGAADDADARANLGLADTGFQNAELCPGVTVPAGSAVGWRRIGNHVFAQAHPVFSYSASQIAIASGFPAPVLPAEFPCLPPVDQVLCIMSVFYHIPPGNAITASLSWNKSGLIPPGEGLSDKKTVRGGKNPRIGAISKSSQYALAANPA